MRRVLYLDCFSGISGDMTVGALCDLGVSPSALEWELAKLDLGDFHTHWERGSRRGIQGVHFSIHEGSTHREEHECDGHHHHDHDHDHDHDHEEPERSYASIRDLLTASDLTPFVKQHALSIFARIAAAEGRIHGVPVDDVHFHEVGGLDSIADVVCACAGIEALGVESVYISPLAEGRGWVECAHGRYPVPSPATLEILAGKSLAQIDEPMEFITPTGAAIAAEFGAQFGPMPALTIEKIGYGIGTRDPANRPNVLRAVLGTLPDSIEPSVFDTDTIVCLEANIDDLTPELIAIAMDELLSAGALDVFCTPVQMKKNRLAIQITVLCERDKVRDAADLLFTHTTTFGVRVTECRRWKLERRFETVSTKFGDVRVKLGSREGKIVRASPELDSCRALGAQKGVPVIEIYRAAQMAFGA
jgi:uncharacterized protein (TIGR00299 family) protein